MQKEGESSGPYKLSATDFLKNDMKGDIAL